MMGSKDLQEFFPTVLSYRQKEMTRNTQSRTGARDQLFSPSSFACKYTQIAISGKQAEACLVCVSP